MQVKELSVLTVYAVERNFFTLLWSLPGNGDMQSVPGGHGKIPSDFPGALVQNPELRHLPDRLQGPQQQPQQEGRDHQNHCR